MDVVRRLLRVLFTAACVALLSLASAPLGNTEDAPWFAPSVGNATQVLSVVGVGPSDAKMDVWQRTAAGWQPLEAGIPAKIGAKGMSPDHTTAR